MSSKPWPSHASLISASKVKTDSFVASGTPIQSTEQRATRSTGAAKSSFKPTGVKKEKVDKPVHLTPSDTKDTIHRHMVPIDKEENYALFVKCQAESSASDIVLVNRPSQFPAECWFLLITEEAYQRTFYQTVQDYSVVDALLKDSFDEIVEFTQSAAKSDKVAFQLLEVEAEDETRSRELIGMLAAKFGNRFFVSQVANTKPCVWKMAICSPIAVAAKMIKRENPT